MRKLITLVIIATAVISMSAQDGTAVVLLNPATVKKKVEKSNGDVQDAKKGESLNLVKERRTLSGCF